MIKNHLCYNSSAIACAKIALSGEYSILYNMPALACTLNKFKTVTHITASFDYASSALDHVKPCYNNKQCDQKTDENINKNTDSKIGENILQKTCDLNFLNIEYKSVLTLYDLEKLRIAINERYNSYLSNKIAISNVIQKDEELILYTISSVLDSFIKRDIFSLKVLMESSIPIRYGLGSSAASIVSCVRAMKDVLLFEMDNQELIDYATRIECLQHGKSSGMDVTLSTNSGCYYIQGNNYHHRIIRNFSIFLVFTGISKSTTGECVEFVKEIFTKSSIKYDFADVTNDMDYSFKIWNDSQSYDSMANLKSCIRRNHALLCKIGVVPSKVQSFIRECEQVGGVAKICGAGSIRGEGAGIVMAIVNEYHIMKLIKKYQYTFCNITINTTPQSPNLKADLKR